MSHVLGAEMVANVHSVTVAAGDRVKPDTMVVLLESMKMEIPVLAEIDGVVREIAVSPGDSIQEGDIIAVIDETKGASSDCRAAPSTEHRDSRAAVAGVACA